MGLPGPLLDPETGGRGPVLGLLSAPSPRPAPSPLAAALTLPQPGWFPYPHTTLPSAMGQWCLAVSQASAPIPWPGLCQLPRVDAGGFGHGPRAEGRFPGGLRSQPSGGRWAAPLPEPRRHPEGWWGLKPRTKGWLHPGDVARPCVRCGCASACGSAGALPACYPGVGELILLQLSVASSPGHVQHLGTFS